MYTSERAVTAAVVRLPTGPATAAASPPNVNFPFEMFCTDRSFANTSTTSAASTPN